jgi:DNA-binding FadR family transcriptional regulator
VTRKSAGRLDALTAAGVPQLSASRHASLVAEIGKRIVSGDYQPGDALPTEAELATMLRVSRNGVREAIKVLASKGLIVSRTKQGISVRPRGHWNMLDPEILRWCVVTGQAKAFWQSVYEVRKIVEPGAAALAAVQATERDIERIAAAYAEMSAVTAGTEEATQADLRFHLAILEASNNAFVRSFAVLIETALASTIHEQNARPGAFSRGVPLHRLVLEAIRSRDPEAARLASNDLLDDVYDAIGKAEREGAAGPPVSLATRRPGTGRARSVRSP